MDKFDNRAAKYTSTRVGLFDLASTQIPQARFLERECAIARLKLKENIKFCDISAGSGYLADGVFESLNGNVDITCIENSQAFVDILKKKYFVIKSSLSNILVPNQEFDRVGCLAGIHHQQNKLAFYKEAFRILKFGGILVIGDVLEESPPAQFLNNPVDYYSDIGHDGMFIREDEVSQQLEEVGFINVTEKVEYYTWNFPDEPSMISYCKNLFRMTKATLNEVYQVIFEYLPVTQDSAGVHLHWQLLFVTAQKL
ncbi:MAG: class I SAM-dependent methyltransferase [Okeania sp. SIO2C9]|uniref:class I SAM-dependent methyltransferase n=1 Tax=Okeania sp. SIO2C9 TaxID=2607791 RepID=UPI0013C12A1D|nr:methyltransferase domain-containing protein [Okeania sp. SIO2C9]NEQ72675.1 class I SAM-dependent methyltransferase [Okeania sp. SIO2C9]